MNKLTIPVILSVTVLIAGVFAFMPVEQASTVHASENNPLGVVTTLSLEKTLDGEGAGEGDDVTWTLTADTDLVVLGIYHDNTPTLAQEGCIIQTNFHTNAMEAVNLHCSKSLYRVLDLEVDGSQWFAGDFPRTFKHLSINEWPETTDNFPLEAGDSITMIFDTTNNGSNDVILDVSFAIKGTATLT